MPKRIVIAALAAIAVVALSGCQYRYVLATDTGESFNTWPCGPIRYQTENATPAQLAFVHPIVAELSHISGRPFTYAGNTGNWDAPEAGTILITFNAARIPDGNYSNWGYGGAVKEPNKYSFRWRHGLVAVAGPAWAQHGVLRHELGHAMGLAHVDDTSEVMYPNWIAMPYGDGWGSGTRDGIARAARFRC